MDEQEFIWEISAIELYCSAHVLQGRLPIAVGLMSVHLLTIQTAITILKQITIECFSEAISVSLLW